MKKVTLFFYNDYENMLHYNLSHIIIRPCLFLILIMEIFKTLMVEPGWVGLVAWWMSKGAGDQTNPDS